MNLESEKNKGKKIKIGAILLVLLTMCVMICLLVPEGNQGEDTSGGKINVELDSGVVIGDREVKDREEIIEDLNKKVEESMINISMNMNPEFETGRSEGNLMIVNESQNNFMQVIEIYNDETGELIYKSGGIPVGSRLETAKLDVELDKGTYPCTAYFNAVTEDGELIGKAGAKIKITINN